MSEDQVVIFELAGNSYAIDIAAVREIIRPQPVTPVPHAPFAVRGVINLRSAIVPVVDLRQRCGLPSAEETPATRIVVVQDAQQGVGLVVDAVSEVTTIATDAIEPVAGVVRGAEAQRLLRGVARLDDRLVLLLDLARVIALDEVADLAAIAVA